MANYEATRYDFSGSSITGLVGVSTGSVIPWSDGSVPSGFLECNGSAVSRSTYSALFAIIGTTYGAGNGSTTFDLPDLQNNVVVGKSPSKALASTGGANTVAQTGNVAGNSANHTLTSSQIGVHDHPPGPGLGGTYYPYFGSQPTRGNCSPSFARGGPGYTEYTGGGGSHSHSASANFSGDATSVVQPYLTVIYIIKT